jgi:thioredoxin 1
MKRPDTRQSWDRSVQVDVGIAAGGCSGQLRLESIPDGAGDKLRFVRLSDMLGAEYDMVRMLSTTAFRSTLQSRATAVIHFDAPWDNYRRQIQAKMLLAQEHFGDKVAFGEIDIDVDFELAEELALRDVPTVAYYRNGELIAALVGASQDIEARIIRLLANETIGNDDGTGSKWLTIPPLPIKREPSSWYQFWK